MATALSDDITELRELLGSVYLTPRQRAALGRLLGAVARSPEYSPVTAEHERVPFQRVIWDDAGGWNNRVESMDPGPASRSPLPPPPRRPFTAEGDIVLTAEELRAIADDERVPLCRRADAEQALADRQREPILTEAEKERERAELLGPIGGGQ